MTAAPVAVLLRRLQARPGGTDDDEVLGRCEGGALAIALELGERLDAPVVAIAVGPARREDRVLAMALRAGCARALRIDDSEVGEVDYLGLAQVLAGAVRHAGARIVVCGDRSQDEAAAAIGPALAELLTWSHLTRVRRVAVEGDAMLVVREADAELQRLRAAAPLVLCALAPPVAAVAVAVAPDDDDEEADRRAARRRKRARTATSIEEIDLADLDIEPRAIAPRRTSAGKLRAVRSKGGAVLSASPEDLVARLRADHLLVVAAPAPAPAPDGPDDPVEASS